MVEEEVYLRYILGFSIVTMLLCNRRLRIQSWKPPFGIYTASNNSNLVVIWEKSGILLPSPYSQTPLHYHLLFLIIYLGDDKRF
jgi:hypothetical protein